MKVTCSDVSAVLGRRTVLSGISLEVPTGSLTAIVGPNGSGKSTLLRVLYRAVRPTRGSAVIGETDVWRAGPRTAARLRAVVPQHQPSQSGLRVREVVELGRYAHLRWFDRTRRDDRKAVDQALSRVGITGLAERPIGALSGGERQRVLLARALVQQAPVLLLDEPT
ncbi:MAG TPA: ABC transporter ATP-binding protein, partial [Microlunatus sp.]|nr:ABC transporter ATP-binding protein [Microlunatus sp.]